MFKAKMRSGALILGLSDENLKRLKEGQPIAFNLKELGLEDREVLIMYGKNEQSIAQELGVSIN